MITVSVRLHVCRTRGIRNPLEDSFRLREGKSHHQVKLKGSISASTHVPVAIVEQCPARLVPALTVSAAWIEQKQLVRGRLTGKR
jgi:hypothetical protein